MSIAPDEEFCASCGETVKERAELCPSCGINRSTSLDRSSRQNVFCTSCGEKIVAEAELCPSCGVRQTATSATGNKKSGSELSEVFYYGQLALGGILLLAAIGSLIDTETSILSSISTLYY